MRRKAVFMYVPDRSPQVTAVEMMLFGKGGKLDIMGDVGRLGCARRRNGGNVSRESFELLGKL